MGNQGYSNAGARECAEIIWSGESATSPKSTPGPIGPLQILAAGSRRRAQGSGPSRPRWIGRPGSAAPRDRPYQPRLCAPQLARVPEFRLRRDRRHGLPHPRHAEHGDAARRARPASNASSRKAKAKYTFPHRIGDPLRLPGPRRHAAGESLLARRHGKPARIRRRSRRRTDRRQGHQRQHVHRRKGIVTTGCYGERTRLRPRRAR